MLEVFLPRQEPNQATAAEEMPSVRPPNARPFAGATAQLTEHVDLYVEWVHQRVDHASLPGRNGFFFNGIEWVINWHF